MSDNENNNLENNPNIDEILENFDEEKYNEFFEKSNAEAEEMLKDEDKLERFFQRLEKKLKAVPVAGNALAYIPLMMSLVRSYVKKEYTDPPIASIMAIMVALIYVVSPVDIIPDFIPGVGYIDDGIVVAGCLALVRTDLEDYRIWRKEHGLEIDDIPDYDEIAKDSKKYNTIIDAFFKGRKSAKNND